MTIRNACRDAGWTGDKCTKFITAIQEFSRDNVALAVSTLELAVIDADQACALILPLGDKTWEDQEGECKVILQNVSDRYVEIARTFNGWTKDVKTGDEKETLRHFKTVFADHRGRLETLREERHLPKSITAVQVKSRPGAGCSVAGGYEAETIRLTWDDIVYGLKMVVGN